MWLATSLTHGTDHRALSSVSAVPVQSSLAALFISLCWMWPLEHSTGWSLGHSAHPLTTVDTATLNNTPAGTAVLYTCKPRLDSGHSVSTTVMHSTCVSCVHRIIYLLTFNISICQYIEFQFMRTVYILVNLSPVQHYCTVQGADVKITPNLPLLPVPARVVNLFSNWSFIFVGDYVSASLRATLHTQWNLSAATQRTEWKIGLAWIDRRWRRGLFPFEIFYCWTLLASQLQNHSSPLGVVLTEWLTEERLTDLVFYIPWLYSSGSLVVTSQCR